MDSRKLNTVVSAAAAIVGCLIVVLWLVLPHTFSPRTQAPVTSRELFLLRVETEKDNMRMLLALGTHFGFIEALDPAQRIRDLCHDADKEGWERWSEIVADMNEWYTRLVVRGTASLDEVLTELYAKYPFLKLQGVEGMQEYGDMIVRTPVEGARWSTTSTEWRNVPGLAITFNTPARTVLVVFEGDLVLEPGTTDNAAGYLRLLINDVVQGEKEFRTATAPGTSSAPTSKLLEWKGDLPEGGHRIGVQAKVSHDGVLLRSHQEDVPKLVLIQ